MSVVGRKFGQVEVGAEMSSATAIPCPGTQDRAAHSGVQGVDRLVMVVGTTLSNWAQEHADRKAMARRSTPLSALSAHEQAQLHREASALRDEAYSARSLYHVIG